MKNREVAARRAREIYIRLMNLPRPNDISNNEWAGKAGVNTSFFTNLKNGSEPSVGNLRAVLEAVGVTLPEFFAEEAQGRLVPRPSKRALIQAIEDALPGLPRRQDRRAAYLAEVLTSLLQLPEGLPAVQDATDSDREESSQFRASTN